MVVWMTFVSLIKRVVLEWKWFNERDLLGNSDLNLMLMVFIVFVRELMLVNKDFCILCLSFIREFLRSL